MTLNRYFELVLSDMDFRTLARYIDLNESDCMYQAIEVDIERYPEFEDTDAEMLYRIFISEEELDEMIDRIDSILWTIEDELGYSAAQELRTLKEDIVYELENR